MLETTQPKNDRSAWLKGPASVCSVLPPKSDHPWRLVLLGAPGVGKGTQAELLCSRLGACHLSTGDVFRAAKNLNACERSPAMNEALDLMRRGALVTDATVLAMVRERVGCLRCGGGFLLDGFPRTVAQAEAVDELLKKEKISLSGVLNYELPLAEIVSRISGRRTCAKCKAVYHVVGMPSKVAGVCDHCGGELLQREDDKPEAVTVRMKAYEHSTAPLTDYYSRAGLLVSISASGTPEEIYQRTMSKLKVRA